MRRKIALLCIMLPLLTCQLHAQEVNDEEEDNTEETTKVSSLLMPNAFSPNGDGINDIYKPKDGYRNIEEFHAYIYNRWGQKLYEWTDLPRDGMAPTAENRSRRVSTSVSSRRREQMAWCITSNVMSTCSEVIPKSRTVTIRQTAISRIGI